MEEVQTRANRERTRVSQMTNGLWLVEKQCIHSDWLERWTHCFLANKPLDNQRKHVAEKYETRFWKSSCRSKEEKQKYIW